MTDSMDPFSSKKIELLEIVDVAVCLAVKTSTTILGFDHLLFAICSNK